MDNEEKKPNININIPEKNQAPVFSNVAQVSATDKEVVFEETIGEKSNICRLWIIKT